MPALARNPLLRVVCLALCVLAAAPAWGQPADNRAIKVEKWDLPQQTAMGQEYPVTAHVRNTDAMPQLVVVRLYHTGNVRILGANEQSVLLEPGGLRAMSWRAERTGDGQSRFSLERYVLTQDLPTGSGIGQQERAALERSWRGRFSDADSVFLARLTLQVAADGKLSGQFAWTLDSHRNPERQGNVGKGGIEYVRGVYLADRRAVYLEGYRRDDPHFVIGLDRYTLRLDAAGTALAGTTWNNGNQDGKLEMSRAE